MEGEVAKLRTLTRLSSRNSHDQYSRTSPSTFLFQHKKTATQQREVPRPSSGMEHTLLRALARTTHRR
jgi:hypothetical protein